MSGQTVFPTADLVLTYSPNAGARRREQRPRAASAKLGAVHTLEPAPLNRLWLALAEALAVSGDS